jgi:hypothetical protein
MSLYFFRRVTLCCLFSLSSFLCGEQDPLAAIRVQSISYRQNLLRDTFEEISIEKAITKERAKLQNTDTQVAYVYAVENIVGAAALAYGAYQFYKHYAGPDLSEQADYKDFLQQLYKNRGGEFTWQERPAFFKRIFRYAAVQGCSAVVAAIGTYVLSQHHAWLTEKKQFATKYLAAAKMILEEQGEQICSSLASSEDVIEIVNSEIYVQGLVNLCAYLSYKEQKKSDIFAGNSFGSIYTIMRVAIQKYALDLACHIDNIHGDGAQSRKLDSMQSIEKIVQSITTICEHVWKYEQNTLNDAVRGNQEAIF